MARRRDTEGTPAPGELELVRSFLSVHDHRGSEPMSLPPSPASLREFFVEHGLIDPDEPVSDRSLRTASLVHTALHRKVEGRNGAARTAAELSVIDEAAREAGLELHFDSEGPPRIEPTAPGVEGALGRILAAAFLAELDGTWEHLKECSDDICTSVFYDRSKNHSGKWCSMQSCGNRNKVRVWRARQRTRGPAA
ncbi:MAG: CGNR zinc finger domain-containing protein [Actinomycetota bacterium]